MGAEASVPEPEERGAADSGAIFEFTTFPLLVASNLRFWANMK